MGPGPVRVPTSHEVGAASALATLGALPLGTPPADAGGQPDKLYVLASIGGAALGGGVVGFVAAGDVRGAATGALLTGGLSGVADGLALFRQDHRQSGGALVGLGVAGVLAALLLAARRP